MITTEGQNSTDRVWNYSLLGNQVPKEYDLTMEIAFVLEGLKKVIGS